MYMQLPLADSMTQFEKYPNMERMCYFTHYLVIIASSWAAILPIPSLDTTICSHTLNFAFWALVLKMSNFFFAAQCWTD